MDRLTAKKLRDAAAEIGCTVIVGQRGGWPCLRIRDAAGREREYDSAEAVYASLLARKRVAGSPRPGYGNTSDPERNWAMWRMRRAKHRTYADIGQHFGISPSRVLQIVARCERMAKRALISRWPMREHMLPPAQQAIDGTRGVWFTFRHEIDDVERRHSDGGPGTECRLWQGTPGTDGYFRVDVEEPD